MNYVFLVGGYYPNFSATGNCISKIAGILSKDNLIEIVAQKKKQNDGPIIIWENQTIHRITTGRNDRRVFLENGHRVKLFFHKVKYFMKFLIILFRKKISL